MALIAWPGLLKPDEADRIRTKLQHVAFEHGSIGALLATWERLKECSIEPVMAVDHGASIAFYYRDPDGNCIELFIDTSGEESEFMQNSRVFQRSAIGTYVDPAQLMAAWPLDPSMIF